MHFLINNIYYELFWLLHTEYLEDSLSLNKESRAVSSTTDLFLGQVNTSYCIINQHFISIM